MVGYIVSVGNKNKEKVFKILLLFRGTPYSLIAPVPPEL
jgi:hypothetical protein